MKKVLITGLNSYVGNSFAKWVKDDTELSVEKISLRDGAWRGKDFSKFDVVLHVAGIAHVSTDPKQEQLYYEVNRDLTIEIAKKAKQDGVKQFIFMSSIIVYGDKIKDGVITEKTVPSPANFYGKSKLQAEDGILPLQSSNYNIAVVRPPMIYGKYSKGNYPKLAKIAKVSPIFPDIENQRSMLHIDNLSEFIKLLILNEDKGFFFPQNEEYVKTSEMVKLIGEAHGKKVKLVKIFNPFIKPFINKSNVLNKVFGNLKYEIETNKISKVNLKKSIDLTEI
ncbi:NAD-dependent epimerase/dehydratase family protein [Oceanobacillus oncorhynchi]|uniref:NAD-dependent epimerase/dehydratase family protein n=1 Tax=Oceanobacillus oncorhynchi TaxID=545501 RepID=UPI00186805A6|nr:NAD-dependent epimerase/dehydratase family protein [Oceanobacillus oncorhynchi]